jgi:hypothetical protein
MNDFVKASAQPPGDGNQVSGQPHPINPTFLISYLRTIVHLLSIINDS